MANQQSRVRVKPPYRVVHDGEAYSDGAEVTVPEATAAEWERARWVERVTSKGKS